MFFIMQRQARIDIPGALHRIMVRGIERRKIFRDNKDRDNFVERLGEVIKDTNTSCYTWALLSNHVHLILRTGINRFSARKIAISLSWPGIFIPIL
jgi:putative transposase